MANKFIVSTYRFHTKEQNKLLVVGHFLEDMIGDNEIKVQLDKTEIPFDMEEKKRVLGGGVVDIVAHGVIHGINREQDVPFLRRVDLHHGVTGFPVLLVHLGLERGGLYGVAAVEPHTVIDVLSVKGSSTHFDYLLS